MSQKNLNTIIFNVAGLGLVVFLGGYMINAALHKETIPSCSKRYGNGQQFSLQGTDGAAMSPIELQARLPTREWGLLKSARVVTDKSAAYLQVALGPHEADAQQTPDPEDAEAREKPRDGVGFIWHPQNFSAARSACLSYRVYLPKDFPFEQRGTLPGLYATEDVAELDESQPKTGFVSRIGWEKGGATGINLRTPLTAGMWMPARATSWPVNRWVTVEQEVVLNAPEKANGIVRLWIDGQLKIENVGLNLGANEETALSGVVSDVGYSETSAKPSRVTLSPFIVQGQ